MKNLSFKILNKLYYPSLNKAPLKTKLRNTIKGEVDRDFEDLIIKLESLINIIGYELK